MNYTRFIEKYSQNLQSSYVLGYLTHLISDDVWLEHIYFKNDFKARLVEDPGLLERWHNDFRLLNGKLIEWFECMELKNELIEGSAFIDQIDEITPNDLQRFKEETLSDFIYTQTTLRMELQVYSFQQILNYIDLAALRTMEALCEITGSNKPNE